MVFSIPGHSLVLASRLTYESMAYRWSYTITWLPFPSLNLKLGGLAIPTYDPSAVHSLQMADGSAVTFFAPLIYLIFLTSSTSETDGQSSSPATCSFVAGSFARPSSPSCSFPSIPPLVSPLPIRDGRYCGG